MPTLLLGAFGPIANAKTPVVGGFGAHPMRATMEDVRGGYAKDHLYGGGDGHSVATTCMCATRSPPCDVTPCIMALSDVCMYLKS